LDLFLVLYILLLGTDGSCLLQLLASEHGVGYSFVSCSPVRLCFFLP
jgi:hypothetical protein